MTDIIGIIQDRLAYDANTGTITWKIDAAHHRPAGSIAGWTYKNGSTSYRVIVVNGQHIHAHRIAWVLTFRTWPKNFIDHINGNGLDNRLCNLRDATMSQNRANSKLPKNNKIGFKGVRLDKVTGRYGAQITINKKAKHIGYFATPERAHAAYCEAAKIAFGEYARMK